MNITAYFPRLVLAAGLCVTATQVQALGKPFSGAQYAQLLTFATEPGIRPLDGYNQKDFLWKHYFHYLYP